MPKPFAFTVRLWASLNCYAISSVMSIFVTKVMEEQSVKMVNILLPVAIKLD